MRGQVDRLTKLSTDLLDLSRLDADAVSLRTEVIDPLELAADVAAEFGAAAEHHGTDLRVQLSNGDNPLVQADRGRTTQIMRILIDNALKHTPPGTEIAISTSSTRNSSRLSVTDNGPGIETRARERVFDRFFTADSVSGSGLGLAIARELARSMGGDVELRRADAAPPSPSPSRGPAAERDRSREPDDRKASPRARRRGGGAGPRARRLRRGRAGDDGRFR